MVRAVIVLPFLRRAKRPAEPELTAADLAAAETVHDAFDADEAGDPRPVAALDGPAAEMREVWDALGTLEARDFDLEVRPASRFSARPGAWAASAAALAACLVAAIWLQGRMGFERYSTAIGERKVIALSDGSELTLNTGTRLEARITASRREVRLLSGEAWFAVQKQSDRVPFLVSAGPTRIRVTGTQFNVRHLTGQTRIDLLEGHIQVSSRKDPGTSSLRAGDAIRLDAEGHMSRLEAADATRVNDWRAGRVSFYQTRLDTALAEINRYTAEPITLASPALGDLRVDGVFDTGDTARFARAAAAVHGLSLRQTGAGLEIRAPTDPAVRPAP
jgi:transmembrane sensor